ncbi:MAG TPA: adenylate/guanylate cyclase domain-containing protein [Acidimicrobiia bacterium]
MADWPNAVNCPACGENVPAGARFCPDCGHALLRRPDERRLVTVLMADIVGFTALSETSDPETVKNLVDRCFQSLVDVITTYGGSLDKIVGDQIVAQFGAPTAHEDDAERAVRSAVTMRDALDEVASQTNHRFALRIGVNTGEVLVGAMRAGGDPTVMGDVVNTASRLQTSAEPGQIIVGHATYLATRNVVRYDELGALEVKGRGETVQAWALGEVTRPPGRPRRARRAALVGRDPEMGTLRHAYKVTTTRHRAQLVLILGDAGVGKTRIAHELATEVSCEQGARVVVGRCAPYGESNVWAPISEALRALCGLDDEEALHGRRDELRGAVQTVTGIADAAPELDRIVDGVLYMTHGLTKPGVDPGRARDDAIRAAMAMFGACAQQRPLVLMLSDVHWADDLVLGALARFLRRLGTAPFLLLATARPDFEQRWAPPVGYHNITVLHLDPLDDEATAELARELYGDTIDDSMVAFFQERSGGNPFFVEELVALVCDTDGAHDRSAEGLGTLPATLHGLIAARLDALPTDLRSVVEDFAVVGAHGPTATALLLSGRDATVLRELTARDLLEVDGDEYHFKSELVRQVAYSTLTKGERARRHDALASQLDASVESHVDQIAHHLACAAEMIDEVGAAAGTADGIRDRALASLAKAARRAEERENFIAGGRFWERALRLMDNEPGELRWEALLGRARARDAFRLLHEARDDAMVVLEEAAGLASDMWQSQAHVTLGRVEADAANYEAAEQHYGQAVTLLRALGDESGVADALRGLGVIRLFQGQLEEAERLVSDSLASFVAAGDRRGEAWAQQNLAMIAFFHGANTDAEERLLQSADLFGEIGDWGGVGWALGMLAFVRFNQGELDEAERLAHQISVEAGETGSRWAEGMMEVLLADIAIWRGRAEESVERARAAVAMFTEMGDHWGMVQAIAPAARALSTLGRFRDADEMLALLDHEAEHLPDTTMRTVTHMIRGAVLVERGECEAAIAQFAMADELAGDRDTVGNVDRVLLSGLAEVQAGRPDIAIELAEPTFEMQTNVGPRAALGGLLALAYAAARRPEDALLMAGALDDMQTGTFMDRLLTRWGSAIAHAQLGDTAQAVAEVDAASAIAYATDSRVVRTVATVARSRLFDVLGVPAAAEAANEASLALYATNITAAGWVSAFTAAFAPAG